MLASATSTLYYSLCYLTGRIGFQQVVLIQVDGLLAKEKTIKRAHELALGALLALDEPSQMLPRVRWLNCQHAAPLLKWLLEKSRGGMFLTPSDAKRDLYSQVVEEAMASHIRLIPPFRVTQYEKIEDRLAIALILTRSPNATHWFRANEVLQPLAKDNNWHLQKSMSKLATGRLRELMTLTINTLFPTLYADLHTTLLQIASRVLTAQEIHEHLFRFENSPSEMRLATPALLFTRLLQEDPENTNAITSVASCALWFSWKHGSCAGNALEQTLLCNAHQRHWKQACKRNILQIEQLYSVDVFRFLQSIHPSWPAVSTWSREAHQWYLDGLPKDLSPIHCLLIGRSVLFGWQLEYGESSQLEAQSIESTCHTWLVETGLPLPEQRGLNSERRTAFVALAALSALETYGHQLMIQLRCRSQDKELQSACEKFGHHFTRLLEGGELRELLSPYDTHLALKNSVNYLLERCELLTAAWDPPQVREGESFSECALRELATFYPKEESGRVNHHFKVQLHDMRLHRWLFVFPHLTLKAKLNLIPKAPARLQELLGNNPPSLALWDGYSNRAFYAMEVNAEPAMLQKLLHDWVAFLSKPRNYALNAHRPRLQEWEERAKQMTREYPLQLPAYLIAAREIRKQDKWGKWSRGSLS